jgi:hypothetical protein
LVTEEDRDEIPDQIKRASIDERRLREKEFFEDLKRSPGGLVGTNTNTMLYIVDIKWVK